MLETLKDATAGILALRELRRLRKDLGALTVAVARIAAALELQNAHAYPQVLAQANRETTVEYVDSTLQASMVDIELRLTRATGQPPTEEDILSEYERMFGPQTAGQE